MDRKRFFGWCPQPPPPNSKILRQFSKPILAILTLTVTVVTMSFLLSTLFMSQTTGIALTIPESAPSETPMPSTEFHQIASPTVSPVPTQKPIPTSDPTPRTGSIELEIVTNKTIYTLAEPAIFQIYANNKNDWSVYRPYSYRWSITNETGYCFQSPSLDLNLNGYFSAHSRTLLWSICWGQVHDGLNEVLVGCGNYTVTASIMSPIVDYGVPATCNFTVVPPQFTMYFDNRSLRYFSEMQAYANTSGLTDWTAKIYPNDLPRNYNETLYNESDVWIYFNEVMEHNITRCVCPGTINITTVYIPTEEVWRLMNAKLLEIPHLQFSPSPIGPVYRVIVDRAYLQQIAEMPEVYCIRIVPAHEDWVPTTWSAEFPYYYP